MYVIQREQIVVMKSANHLDNNRRITIKSRQVSHLWPGLMATNG